MPWLNRGDEVARVAETLREHLAAQAVVTATSDERVARAAWNGPWITLAREFDQQAGGFGERRSSRRRWCSSSCCASRRPGTPTEARRMLDSTLTAMARGGIHDQLAGGFARYSVDREWVVPHFEKMLYDNALLLRVYAGWGTDVGVWAAEGIADFLLGELRTPEGGFASALDADSEGAEGTYYVWTPAQLVDVLGPDDGPWAASLLCVTGGDLRARHSTLQLLAAPDDLKRWYRVQRLLRSARDRRERPARDDKVVAAWNGLAISGLCRAGRCSTGRRTSGTPGRRRLLWRVHMVDGRLRRVSRDGVVGRPGGVLEDYGCVASGFLDLLQATGDPVWLHRAEVPAGRGAGALRGGRRRLLRHRGRRRGAGRPTA